MPIAEAGPPVCRAAERTVLARLRRRLIVFGVVAGSGVLLGPGALAQQVSAIHRVGILNPNSPAIAGKYVEAFLGIQRRQSDRRVEIRRGTVGAAQAVGA